MGEKEKEKYISWLKKQGKPIDKIVKRAMTEKQRVLLTETNGDANIDWDTRSLKDAITLLKHGLNYLQEIEVKKQTMPSSRFGGCSEYIPTRFDREKQGKQGEQNLPSFDESQGTPILKQGEQKPADIPEDFEKLVEHLLSLSNGEGHGSPAKVKEVSAELLRLANQQKPVWSEEDEAHIDSLLKRLEGMCKPDATFTSTGFAISEDEDWLKSLKDRVQPQTKQEWSEEDETYLNTTIVYLKDAKEFKKTAENCINWLKSLRPQSKQVLRDTFGYEDGRQFGKNEVLGNPEKYGLQRFAEWSKSDKEIVKEIDTIIHGTNSISDEVRKKLQDWLKSLRPQSHWKPSDEQMDAMQKAVFYFGNSWVSDEQKALTSLFSELKKLKGE